jgi:hypothetical protein
MQKYSFKLVKICYLAYKLNHKELFNNSSTIFDLYVYSDECKPVGINLNNKKIIKRLERRFLYTNIVEYNGDLYEMLSLSPCPNSSRW